MKRFKPWALTLLLLTLTGPALAQTSGWSMRGGGGYLKGSSVPVADLELELAYRFAGWQGRFEAALLYGAYVPLSLPQLRDNTGLFGLAWLHGLQLRSRFYLFDAGMGPLEPYVSVQAGLINWPGSSGWILPSFGLGLDWYLTPQLAISPALYVPFWTSGPLGVQLQPELALKWRF